MHQFITRLAFLSLVSCASIALAQPPTQAPQSSVRAVDWQPAALPPAVFTDWSDLSVRPGLSAARAQTPEGEAAIMRVEAKTRNALIPINIEIPPDTRTLGVWLREGARGNDGPAAGAEAAGMDITVQFVRDNKTENVKLSQLLSATPKSNAQNAGFTPFAKEDGWVLRRAFLDSVGDGRPAQRIVLRSLRLTGATTRVLDFGPLLACPQSTRATSARKVWKLKDFQEVKPVSNNWTSTQFYEYGYDENPSLRASAWKRLLRKPGEPTVAANSSQVASLRAIIRASNGTPLQTFTRRGEELNSALPLPVLGEGSYFMQLSGIDASGVLVGEVPFVYQMLRHDGGAPVAEAKDVLPLYVRGLNYNGPSGRAGEKLELAVSLAPTAYRKASTLRAVWNIIDGDNKEQAKGEGVLGADDSSSTPIAFTPPTGGAYQLDIRLFDAENRLVERQREMIGVAARTRAASRILPKVVAPENGQPLMLGTMQVLFEAGQTHRLPQTELPSLIKWTEGAGLTPILVINWNELEPVEGCFAWHLLDRVLDMASKETGAFVGLRFAGDLLPQWLWFEELLSHNQQTINAEYHYSSPLGPRLRPALDRAWRVIAERYRDDPRVRGFFTAAGPSEGFLTDGSSVVSDYSPAGRETFRVWLKQQYGELAKINATWGERFTTWNDIQPPVPNYDLSWESSAAWWDWHRFKQSFTNERVDEMQKVLRASEPDRPITMYARQGFGATGELAPIFANNKFRYINGGGEGGLSYVQMSIMRNYNVPVTVEGHAVMPNLGSTNWVLLNSLLSGFGGNNVQMGAVWSKTSHKTPEYSAVQALQKRFAEAAPELSATRLETNWAGFYSNVHTMLRTRSFRNGGYPGVTDLNTVAQEGFHIPCEWVDDNTDAAILAHYPLLVDTGAQVLAPAGVKLLLDYARNGGTLVIGATMGRFIPGSAEPVDALLNQLGASEVTAQSTPPPANTDADVPVLCESFKVKWNAAAKAKVVLADESGAPLLWQVDSGRGRVLVVAGTLDIKKSQSWLREIVLQFAGTPVVKIETTDNAVAGVLRHPQTGVRYVAMMLAPSKRALPDYNLTSAQIAAMGKADVTIRGPFKAGTQIENIADGTHITVMKDNEVTLSVQRGTLYCLKLPWRA